jgi:hypothetical protein
MLGSKVGANDCRSGDGSIGFIFDRVASPAARILSDSTDHQMFGLGFRADFGCRNYECVSMSALQASASTIIPVPNNSGRAAGD